MKKIINFRNLILIITVFFISFSQFSFVKAAVIVPEIAEGALEEAGLDGLLGALQKVSGVKTDAGFKIQDYTVKFLSEEEYQKMKNNQTPDLMKAWDFVDLNGDGRPDLCKIPIDNDLAKRWNDFVNDIVYDFVTADTPSTPINVESKTYYTDTGVFDISVSYVDGGKSHSYVYHIPSCLSFSGPVARIDETTRNFIESGWWYSQVKFDFYKSDGTFIDGRSVESDIYNPSDKKFPSFPTYSVSTPLRTSKPDKSVDYSNYLPMPLTGDELKSGQEVMTEVQVPIKYDENGNPVPDISFPMPEMVPTNDPSKQKIGDVVTVMENPVVDPSNNKITNYDNQVSNDTNDDTDTNTTPSGNTDTSLPFDVPTDHFDFNPLMVATMKFPFCIPWDLADLIKTLDANEEAPHFKFNDMPFTASGFGTTFTIPGFEFNLADLPQVTKIVSILKFFEVLLFIGVLIFKTRDMIRG